MTVLDDDLRRAVVRALRGMEDYGPEDLLGDARHNLARSGRDTNEDELVDLLTSGAVNAAALTDFHIALSRWDAEPSADWTDNTAPSTRDRRTRVLQLLGLSDHAADRINEAHPPYLVTDISILDPDWDPWYTPDRRRAHRFYWPAYERVLQRTLDANAIGSLDAVTTNIVSRLADPTAEEPYQSKGLVVGHVQSGKTANFTGVIAKAIDSGYRLVIVLTGTVELLRAQTQRRLDMELIGEENILGGHNGTDPDAIADVDYAGDGDVDWAAGKFLHHDVDFGLTEGVPAIRRLTGKAVDYKRLAAGLDALDFRSGNELRNPRQPVWHPDNLYDTNVRIAVVKKNKAVLAKLVQDLRNVHARLDEIPTLIIDDEADQASVNTVNPRKQSSEDLERTAINALIAQLLGELKRAQYIGYTATPFANVFVSPEDSEDIFPKDFIISLTPPDVYMGGRAFHDLDGIASEDIGNPAVSNEAAFIRDLRADEEDADDELRSALDAFVLTGAVKLWRSTADPTLSFRHHTMLVHESVRTTEHKELAQRIRSVWDRAAYASPATKERLREMFERDFTPVSASRDWEAPMPKFFDDLVRHIGSAVDRIRATGDPVIIVNGDKDREYEQVDFQTGDVWRILVGGTKLSRGFTVEGLTVTYYRRRALQADSLMQMGRWFGYRRGYQDLVRLFIARNAPGPRRKTYDLYEAFEALVEDEEDFRAQLHKFSELDDDGEPMIRPSQVPPLVFQQLPWLKPTARNKMYNAELDFVGEGGQLRDFPRQPERDRIGTLNRQHFNAVADWLPRLGDTVEFEYLDRASARRASFKGRTVIISAAEMMEALQRFRWVDGFSMAPTLSMLERAAAEGTLVDWAVMVPYLDRATRRDVDGHRDLPILRRSRRGGTRGGFSGSSFRQRDAIEQIAGGIGVDGGPNAAALHTPTRGAMLLTFAYDPYNESDRNPAILPESATAADVATLFSLALPRLSAPRGRIGFRVRDLTRESDPIVSVD